MKQELIFVYNANSDLFSSLTDFAYKIISPKTYNCNLCAVMYGNFSMKDEWKEFIKQLHVEVVFLHKNEFEKLYQQQINLPAVFIKGYEELMQIVSNEGIDNCKSLQQLKDLVSSKLAMYDKHHHSNI